MSNKKQRERAEISFNIELVKELDSTPPKPRPVEKPGSQKPVDGFLGNTVGAALEEALAKASR